MWMNWGRSSLLTQQRTYDALGDQLSRSVAARIILKQFHLGDGDVAIKANIDIGLGRAAPQVVVARVIQAGLFFVPIIQWERFRIERTPNDLRVRRAGR